MDDADPRLWEYRTLAPPREPTMKEARDPVEPLNALGHDGWRLADTIDYVGGGTKFLVLMRPAGSEAGSGDRSADDEPNDEGHGGEPDDDQEPTASDE